MHARTTRTARARTQAYLQYQSNDLTERIIEILNIKVIVIILEYYTQYYMKNDEIRL